MKIPLGLRINNPCNLRSSKVLWRGQLGSRNGFVYFDSLDNGYRAFFILCRTYFVKYHIHTVSGFISRYAPSTENDTQNYIKFVVGSLSERGFSDQFLLNKEFLINLASIITQFEQGFCDYHCECIIRKVADIYIRGWYLIY